MKKILYIGNKLNKTGSNVSYISVLGSLLSREGFVMFYASSKLNKVLRLLDMISKVIRFGPKVDKVLIDTYSTQNYYYAFIISQLCRLLKVDYLPILHGGNLPSRLKSNPRMSRMIFKNAEHNISPSAYLKNAFEEVGYKNVIHIPNTIEITNYPFTKRTFDEPRLLWLRSFSVIYNPQLALKVMDLLKKSHPGVQLCMVGPDSDGTLDDLKKMAENLNLDVKFTGKLSKQDWIKLSKDYNIFINTTNFDNMPVSVIEAMALGLPVVSTNVGGMPFLIESGKNGILVEPENAEEMAQAVLSLLYDGKTRHNTIECAREQAEQFDWKNVKKIWLKILN